MLCDVYSPCAESKCLEMDWSNWARTEHSRLWYCTPSYTHTHTHIIHAQTHIQTITCVPPTCYIVPHTHHHMCMLHARPPTYIVPNPAHVPCMSHLWGHHSGRVDWRVHIMFQVGVVIITCSQDRRCRSLWHLQQLFCPTLLQTTMQWHVNKLITINTIC